MKLKHTTIIQKAMDANPLVSIGLPTYSRGRVLKRTLDSLLGQTYRNIELIISDDASFDATPKICEEYAGKDSRICYFRQEKNLGMKGNFYFVLSKARGRYFMRAGDDDWWDKTFIEKLAKVLEDHPGYAWAVSSFARVYNNGEIEEEILFEGENELTGKSPYEIYKRILMRKKGHDHLNYGILKRELFQKIALRRPPDKGWDAILGAQMALAGKVYSIPEVLRFSNNKLESPSEKVSKITPRPAQKLRKPKFPLVSTTYTNLFLASLSRGLTSPAVPLHRKVFVIFPWLSALWIKRKKFFGFFYGNPGRFFSFTYLKKKIPEIRK